MLKRLLPFPVMSAFLLLMWLLLNETLAFSHWLLGGLIAWGVPYATRQLQPMRAERVRRPLLALRLLGVVLFDVCRSCYQVSKIILGGGYRRRDSGFMTVPLDIHAPHGLAVLAVILNSTPGTAWVELSEDRRLLMIHVLDLHDEQWWINTIKQRYEIPLKAIFE